MKGDPCENLVNTCIGDSVVQLTRCLVHPIETGEQYPAFVVPYQGLLRRTVRSVSLAKQTCDSTTDVYKCQATHQEESQALLEQPVIVDSKSEK